MDDSIKFILGFIGTSFATITGWNHHRTAAAHKKIEETHEKIDIKLDEKRKETKADLLEVYHRIKHGEDKVERHRHEVDIELADRMKRHEIISLVDKEVKSIHRSIDAVNSNVDKMGETLISQMKVLIERQKMHRKDD